MNRTPLHDEHLALGAKMVPFAGYEMPVSYSGIKDEHHAVRKNVGLFDVSHMGEFFISGQGALDLIQYVTSNDASKLYDGRVQYSCLPNGKGGIVDDLLVYRISEEEYMLVVNASNREKDLQWIEHHNRWECTVADRSDNYGLLAVQGPKAVEALENLTDLNLAEMKYYTFGIGSFAGIKDVLISATGYTGSGGFEIYVKNEDAPRAWKAVLDAGKEQGIMPAGLGARDTLRLEMGFCLYGNDIDDSTSPLEAGLGWITKLKKDADFIDKQRLIEQKASGLENKLVGFVMKGRGIPRQGYEIVNEEDERIGRVTSGSESPSTEQFVGLGYVPVELAKEGTEIIIAIRKKRLKAEVRKLPFYRNDND